MFLCLVTTRDIVLLAKVLCCGMQNPFEGGGEQACSLLMDDLTVDSLPFVLFTWYLCCSHFQPGIMVFITQVPQTVQFSEISMCVSCYLVVGTWCWSLPEGGNFLEVCSISKGV